MRIERIHLENFRNYKHVEIFPDKSRNIIVGENAQGKTNLIEAIYMAAFAKSFRTNNAAEMVSFGAKQGRIGIDIFSEELEKNINITIRTDGKKMIQKDGKAIRKIADLLNTVVVIIFSPDDLRIIKDSPDRRRTFLNSEISQIRPRYYEVLREYNETLRQKNALLKGYFNVSRKTFTRADNLMLNEASRFDNSRKFNEEMLDIYDRKLADSAYEIVRYRKDFVEMLSTEAEEIVRKISGDREQLKIKYKTTCDFVTAPEGRDIIYEQFYNRRDKDIYAGSATAGPHRDDIEFYINGEDAKKYGSQGQQRTIALALKLAEIRMAKIFLEESPILLLDDVLSELDLDRQRFLVSEIDDVQLFITSAEINEEVIKYLKGGTLLRVEEGSITRVDKY
ncbi:MAG TPA: DNA replication/repair protein RecF [Mogibacterium sp.]|nr:DNA replication/repair protein RecF [Mogibacterium sp.]